MRLRATDGYEVVPGAGEIAPGNGGEQRRKDVPGLQVVEVPDAIGASPEYGVAVLKDARPGAAELALHILSPEG